MKPLALSTGRLGFGGVGGRSVCEMHYHITLKKPGDKGADKCGSRTA